MAIDTTRLLERPLSGQGRCLRRLGMRAKLFVSSFSVVVGFLVVLNPVVATRRWPDATCTRFPLTRSRPRMNAQV